MNAYQHWYHNARQRGLCVHCGRHPALDGRCYCAGCRVRKVTSEAHKAARRRHKQRVYAERRELGLCVDCGQPAMDSKSRCEVHRRVSESRIQRV